MEEKEVLSKVSDTVTNAPTIIEIDMIRKGFFAKLLERWKVLPPKKRFAITGITLGNLVRVSKALLSMGVSVEDLKHNFEDAAYNAIVSNSETAAHIVAVGLHNSKGEPPKALVNFVLQHFTAKEMLTVLLIIKSKMDVTSFISSIISMRGLNVLQQQTATAKSAEPREVSPMSQRETIAPGALSVAS